MRTINKKTGEINTFKVKGLWSHFPIPAYQVLGRQKEFTAQRLLICLCSFLGDSGNCVYPSYLTISRVSGISKSSIRKALNVLEDNGFITTFKYWEGKKSRNKYYFNPSCWDTSKMNSIASKFRTPTHKCLDCKKLIDNGGFGEGKNGKVHWNCGGPVISIRGKTYI
jgi:Fe2+ or Zn2+ uptake regulation protein